MGFTIRDVVGILGMVASISGGAVVGWRICRSGQDAPVPTSGFFKGTSIDFRLRGCTFLFAMFVLAPLAMLAEYLRSDVLGFLTAFAVCCGIGIFAGTVLYGVRHFSWK